jgi:endonuclease YncB( thermonuclease family)
MASVQELCNAFAPYGSQTKDFSLKGKCIPARVVSIYDGDTCKVVVNLFDSFYRFTIRLKGIDCCEIKSKTEANHAMAVKARDRLFQLVVKNEQCTWNPAYLDLNVCLVTLQCYDTDKYGRTLAEVYPFESMGPGFSKILLREKLAYEYNGDTKLSESQQLQLLT